jgi:hypothetical protein
MANLRFDGELDMYGGDRWATGPEIGGRDVIKEIENVWPYRSNHRHQVRVTLGVEPVARGGLWAIHGWGGTEITPPDSPEITIGGFDLLDRLRNLDGRYVILIIEDLADLEKLS